MIQEAFAEISGVAIIGEDVAGITPKEKRTLLINDIESDDPAKRTQARMDILSKLNEFTPDERMSLLGAIARGKNK